MSSLSATPVALPSDLTTYALPPQAVSAIPTTTQTQEIDAASETAADYLRGRGSLPLQQPYPTSLTKMVCYITAYNLMITRGIGPADKKLVTDRYNEAIQWLKDVQRQAVHPAFIFSTPPAQDATYGLPLVNSDKPRGWQTPAGCTPKVGW